LDRVYLRAHVDPSDEYPLQNDEVKVRICVVKANLALAKKLRDENSPKPY